MCTGRKRSYVCLLVDPCNREAVGHSIGGRRNSDLAKGRILGNVATPWIEDRVFGGYEYAGIAYEKQGEMLAARRRHYVELVLAGMGYAEAARAVGVSKRTGKVWRNGRTRSTGRNEAPCAEWTEAAMPQLKPTGPRYLSMDERIFIADGLVCGLSMSAIASRLGRSRSTVCREVARNRDRGTGRYTPYRAGDMAAARRRRPKPRKLKDRRLAAAVQAKLDVHWSPEQISHWLAAEEAQRGVPGADKRFADSLESGAVDRGCCDVP